MVRLRTCSHAGVVPATVVVQVLELMSSVRDADEDWTGATALMSGATVLEARAVASACVSVDAEPNPWRMPLEDVELPGETVSRLVPSELMAFFT